MTSETNDKGWAASTGELSPREAGREPRRIGLISDIHANLHALIAVLENLDEAGVDKIYCCGDVVGYGPFPNECCEIIRDRGIPTIAGNHDHAALGMTTVEYFNDVAKRAVQWTSEELTEENRRFLRNLPMTIDEEDFLLVHASPNEPREWNYILTISDARESFRHFSHPVCFIGHTHQPFIVKLAGGNLTCPVTPRIRMAPGERFLVNIGSVGQPRDQNKMASFAVYDRGEMSIEIIRRAYDVAAVQEAIREKNLPIELGERLAHGW